MTFFNHLGVPQPLVLGPASKTPPSFDIFVPAHPRALDVVAQVVAKAESMEAAVAAARLLPPPPSFPSPRLPPKERRPSLRPLHLHQLPLPPTSPGKPLPLSTPANRAFAALVTFRAIPPSGVRRQDKSPSQYGSFRHGDAVAKSLWVALPASVAGVGAVGGSFVARHSEEDDDDEYGADGNEDEEKVWFA